MWYNSTYREDVIKILSGLTSFEIKLFEDDECSSYVFEEGLKAKVVIPKWKTLDKKLFERMRNHTNEIINDEDKGLKINFSKNTLSVDTKKFKLESLITDNSYDVIDDLKSKAYDAINITHSVWFEQECLTLKLEIIDNNFKIKMKNDEISRKLSKYSSHKDYSLF